jgi:hypothetical protein
LELIAGEFHTARVPRIVRDYERENSDVNAGSGLRWRSQDGRLRLRRRSTPSGSSVEFKRCRTG